MAGQQVQIQLPEEIQQKMKTMRDMDGGELL